MKRWLVLLAAAILVLGGLVLILLATLSMALAAARPVTGGLPTRLAVTTIPAEDLTLYQDAARACPGLPWTVLAAIGQIESDHGRATAPGVHAGANAAGEKGPMRLLPATFARYATPVPPGGAAPPSPYDPADAIWAAARLLCANGGQGGADIPRAILAYRPATAYVNHVLTIAARYGTSGGTSSGGSSGGTSGSAGGSGVAVQAVAFALAQLGTPYRWGGDGPQDGGFDCSGLVQAAYRAAGVQLPRVAQAQYDATPPLSPSEPLLPGDLVFFGSSPSQVTHVGIVVGPGVMVDAPHTGAFVRVEPYRWADLLGATRPGNQE